jgi:dTDP-4-amino-4,6-dideoxygalactose transaminase
LGDVAAFSFCQDKIMTTAGEGGMVTTNSTELWNRMWSLKDHGKSYDAVFNHRHPAGFRWLHQSFGTNWRMTEVQSAVGRSMLRKLPEWVGMRRRYAGILNSRLANVPGLRITLPPDYVEHAYYKYYIFVKPDELQPDWTRDRIAEAINAQGIRCFTGSCSEIYLEMAFPSEWRPKERLPVARELGETSLMFLVHPTMAEEQIIRTCDVISNVMSSAVCPVLVN